MAYLAEHTWYTTFRRQSVFSSVGAFFPPRFVSEGVRRVLRKTQTGGTHRSTCAQTGPHWGKGQPEKGQKARGSRGVEGVEASVCRALHRMTQDSKEGGPTPPHPPPMSLKNPWLGLRIHTQGLTARVQEWSKCILLEGWASNSHAVADTSRHMGFPALGPP